MKIPEWLKWFCGGLATAAAVVAAFFLGKRLPDESGSPSGKEEAEKAKERKKNEIEKTNAGDLVDSSPNAADLRSRIKERQRKFSADADRAVSDLLRNASSGSVGRRKKDSGKRD